jgi:hypothetical protein
MGGGLKCTKRTKFATDAIVYTMPFGAGKILDSLEFVKSTFFRDQANWARVYPVGPGLSRFSRQTVLLTSIYLLVPLEV